MRRWAVVPLFGALAIAPMAACGKSEPTKAQFISRANAVCADEEKRVKRLAEERNTPDELVRESFRVHEAFNAKLRAIPVPPKEKVPREWLHARETAIAASKKILVTKPHSHENDAANKAYSQGEKRAVQLALSYGLRKCIGFASA